MAEESYLLSKQIPEPVQTQSQQSSQQLMHESGEGGHSGEEVEENADGVIASSITPSASDIATRQLPASIHPRIGSCRQKKNTSALPRGIVQKKLALLNDTFRPIPLSRGKALDLSAHERLFRALGLWHFAQLEFDREIRSDLLAHLIAYYDPSNRRSYVHGCEISVTRRDLCTAIDLPTNEENGFAFDGWNSINDIVYSDKVLLAFISNYMLLVDDTCIVPSEILQAIELVKGGLPHKVDWGGAMWVLVEKELLDAPIHGTCYYASYLQRLVKTQHPLLFSTEPERFFRYVPEPAEEQIELEEEEGNLAEELAFVEGEGVAEATRAQSSKDLCNVTTEEHVSELGLIKGGDETMVNCAGDGKHQLFDEEKSNGSEHYLQHSDGIYFDDKTEGDYYQKQKESCADELSGSAKLSDLNRTTSPNHLLPTKNADFPCAQLSCLSMPSGDSLTICADSEMNILLEKSKVKREMGEFTEEEEQQLVMFNKPKRMRSWAQPSSFNDCLDLLEGIMKRTKALYAEKAQAQANLEAHAQNLSDMLRVKEKMSRSLKKMVEDQPNWRTSVRHYEHEIVMVSQIMHGYKRVLKEAQSRFTDYRKKHPQEDDSLYKDIPGTGGLVVSATEFDRHQLEKVVQHRLKVLQSFANLDRILNKLNECRERLVLHDKKLVCLLGEVKQLQKRVVKSSSSGTQEEFT